MKDDEEKEEYQEVVISFNKKGTVVDFHTAISSNLYVKVIKKVPMSPTCAIGRLY